jgi:hypothetical protein
MASPKLSLKATFGNPKIGGPSGAAGLGVKVGMKVGMQGREKMGVPYISVDGVEHAGDWQQPTLVDITPGAHQIEVYYKLKGLPIKRGKGKADFTVPDDEGEVSVSAYFGMMTTTEVKVPSQPVIRRKRLPF